ncbi:MAG: DNA replication/repair protein RecF [Candidatus Gracilibacteria bacterium]|jgi:DNA replication and repair protein RecF
MNLKYLQLENFRNYKTYPLDFGAHDNNLTILTGENGIGKSNLIESIYALSLGKSFRVEKNVDLILKGENYYRAKGEISSKSEESSLEIFYSETPQKKKNFKKNGVSISHSDYIGNFLTVLFQPEDLNILYLSPHLRRRYLDVILSQTERKYLFALTKYNKILKQRNALLKEIKIALLDEDGKKAGILRDDLAIWTEEMIQYATIITEYRIKLFNFINERLNSMYTKISGGNEALKVVYESKAQNAFTPEEIKESLRRYFQEKEKIEILQGRTLGGPHRDDLLFFIEENRFSGYGSRGEIRTLMLALKLIEISYIKEKTGELPVLLLDDVLSELDFSRQKHLINEMTSCQTIISTADEQNLSKIAKDSRIIKLDAKR